MITLAHGGGGQESARLMQEIFGKHFTNPILDRMEDGAVLPFPVESVSGAGGIVVSTDSFVVTPLNFPGGDIGKLAVCGTVNDVLMMGAIPKYLTCGFILEEGLGLTLLDKIVCSMAETSTNAGVQIVAGDTKVVPGRGGVYINTTGIGFLRTECLPGAQGIRESETRNSGTRESVRTAPSASRARAGDVVIVSGTLGDHHACILSARMGIENGIQSDCAALTPLVNAIFASGAEIHTLRDITRGGLATVLNEIASASAVHIELREEEIPVTPEVRAFCGIMGLDPLYMGNEGKIAVIVPQADAERVLTAMRITAFGKDARVVGRIYSDEIPQIFSPAKPVDDKSKHNRTGATKNVHGTRPRPKGIVTMKTKIGGTRRVDMLLGEGLPRIC